MVVSEDDELVGWSERPRVDYAYDNNGDLLLGGDRHRVIQVNDDDTI